VFPDDKYKDVKQKSYKFFKDFDRDDIARLVGEYYRAMLDSVLSDDLARGLTLQYHQILLERWFEEQEK
jgi:hypothetical protein